MYGNGGNAKKCVWERGGGGKATLRSLSLTVLYLPNDFDQARSVEQDERRCVTVLSLRYINTRLHLLLCHRHILAKKEIFVYVRSKITLV